MHTKQDCLKSRNVFTTSREDRLRGWLAVFILLDVVLAIVLLLAPEILGAAVCYFEGHTSPPHYALQTEDGKPVDVHITTHRCWRCGKVVEMK